MDASASPKVDADFNKVYGFYLKIENTSFPSPIKQRSTIIKYTKLPDFEYDRKVTWPQDSYMLQPRLRRIITLEDDGPKTTRSLKTDLSLAPKMATTTSITKRKIVTITEDDENDLHPKFSKDIRKQSSVKKINRSVGPDFKDEKELTHRSTSRLNSSSKYSKETKPSAKMNTLYNRKETSVPNPNYIEKHSNASIKSTEYIRPRNVRAKDISRKTKSENASSRTSVSKNFMPPSEGERQLLIVKTKLLETAKPDSVSKKLTERSQSSRPPPVSKSKVTFLKEIQSKNKPVSVIHVPLDERIPKRNTEMEGHISSSRTYYSQEALNKTDCGTDVDDIMNFKDVKVGTEPQAETVDQVTEMDNFDYASICKCVQSTDVQTEVIKDIFDSLEIPNVTLTKDKAEPTQENDNFHSNSLPNLQVPPLKISPRREEKNPSDKNVCKSASYIISRATLTYTTKQKINFHVVGNNEDNLLKHAPNPLAYPINVVSVFKNEMKKNKDSSNATPRATNDESSKSYEQKRESDIENTKCFNEMKSLNCSYVFNSNKLMKPSDIISTIGVNNGLLQSDYVCEQFQRELNFIDSFFESLQYLESCSLSEKCFTDITDNRATSLDNNPVSFEPGFDAKNPDYGTFLSKFENGANVDDTETMASKSLCLLNLLIRDEQRRAKNLLFVLKMREDALKDFTKSQILWLENKKKHENTDISTLKKKQRGALLKLQHECGEMQRMRKALLTLSEKRKLALMKTKKNIELKLKNNVDVEQILLGKKKLKRSTAADRNAAPLKCFDLSSSGCDESTTSRPNSETAALTPEILLTASNVKSAEKCIQTGDSVFGTVLVDQSTDTAAENFVVVDGGYLNILFHNLSLPQIFSGGKQYEVNEEALKNILSSANSHHSQTDGSEVVEKLMDQIKNCDLDSSDTPSTARSLVEEFDQYYKGLTEEDKSPVDSPNRDYNSADVYEIKDSLVQATDLELEQRESPSRHSASTMTSDSSGTVVDSNDAEQSCVCDALCSAESVLKEEPVAGSQAGPLPVPAGAASVPDPVSTAEVPVWPLPKSSTSFSLSDSSVCSQPQFPSVSSMSSLTSPVHFEAEELRRQQLAIEREIKALEQQQCRLLVVREIPDKPPPPYTPPTDARAPKPPRMFLADETTDEKLQKQIADPTCEAFDSTDVFDTFVRDFCQDSVERQKSELSDKPWDACNLLPQKPQLDSEKLVQQTSADLIEVLTGVTPTVVSGVGARRSDHIDDILFAEWRRCEPEWTSLHTDEAIVKNQIFESIFQKILTETIDEYKRTVQCKVTDLTCN